MEKSMVSDSLYVDCAVLVLCIYQDCTICWAEIWEWQQPVVQLYNDREKSYREYLNKLRFQICTSRVLFMLVTKSLSQATKAKLMCNQLFFFWVLICATKFDTAKSFNNIDLFFTLNCLCLSKDLYRKQQLLCKQFAVPMQTKINSEFDRSQIR